MTSSNNLPVSRKTVQEKPTDYDVGYIQFTEELKLLRGVSFQWYGYRQVDYSKKCDCNNSTELSKPGCSRCFRTGYLFNDFLVKGYIWLVNPGAGFTTPFGTISTQSKFMILEWNRPVQKFSFVLELDQDPETGNIRQPFSIMRAYEIQDFSLTKGREGRVEWSKCLLEERNIDDGRPNELGTGINYKGNRSIPDL